MIKSVNMLAHPKLDNLCLRIEYCPWDPPQHQNVHNYQHPHVGVPGARASLFVINEAVFGLVWDLFFLGEIEFSIAVFV